jgi:hypothetical protein
LFLFVFFFFCCQKKGKSKEISKWKVLRNALLGRANDVDDQKASIHRHAGFTMLEKKISEWEPPPLTIFVSADKTKALNRAVSVYVCPFTRCWSM